MHKVLLCTTYKDIKVQNILCILTCKLVLIFCYSWFDKKKCFQMITDFIRVGLIKELFSINNKRFYGKSCKNIYVF